MNFLGIEEKYSAYETAQAVILPLPYEQTTSYMTGTAKGPRAIIDASAYVELYDEELEGEVYRGGIHTLPTPVFSGEAEADFKEISRKCAQLLKDEKFIVSLGGEHSVSFPVVRAFNAYFSKLSVLQLDAHSDLRASYEGSIYSHASVMRRIFELNRNIVQIGIRSQCHEEADFIRQNKINTLYAQPLHKTGFAPAIPEALTENVYLTIDVDFFDPSIMPATGTPEPGGFLWNETLAFLKTVFETKNVVGLDVVELSPLPGLVHPDFLSAKLIYKLLGYKFL